MQVLRTALSARLFSRVISFRRHMREHGDIAVTEMPLRFLDTVTTFRAADVTAASIRARVDFRHSRCALIYILEPPFSPLHFFTTAGRVDGFDDATRHGQISLRQYSATFI